MPVSPGSGSPSQRWSLQPAPFCHASTQCSTSVVVSNPSFCLYQAADFFASETITATLKSFESMARVGIGWFFPFSLETSGRSFEVCRLDLLPVSFDERDLFEVPPVLL